MHLNVNDAAQSLAMIDRIQRRTRLYDLYRMIILLLLFNALAAGLIGLGLVTLNPDTSRYFSDIVCVVVFLCVSAIIYHDDTQRQSTIAPISQTLIKLIRSVGLPTFLLACGLHYSRILLGLSVNPGNCVELLLFGAVLAGFGRNRREPGLVNAGLTCLLCGAAGLLGSLCVPAIPYEAYECAGFVLSATILAGELQRIVS